MVGDRRAGEAPNVRQTCGPFVISRRASVVTYPPAFASLVSSATPGILAATRDGVEIVFYVVVGLITLLAYLTARKTFFQPRHAEVFRMVAEQCVQIADLVCGKDDAQLLADLGIYDMVTANGAILFDGYAYAVFGIEVPEPDERAAEFGEFSGHLVSDEAILPSNEPFRPGTASLPMEEPATARLPYRPTVLVLSDDYLDYMSRLDALRRSTITPASIKKSLNRYYEVCDGLPSLLLEMLQACAEEMADLYPTLDALNDGHTVWMTNMFNHGRPDLLKLTEAVCAAIDKYLNVDRTFR